MKISYFINTAPIRISTPWQLILYDMHRKSVLSPTLIMWLNINFTLYSLGNPPWGKEGKEMFCFRSGDFQTFYLLIYKRGRHKNRQCIWCTQLFVFLVMVYATLWSSSGQMIGNNELVPDFFHSHLSSTWYSHVSHPTQIFIVSH